MSDDDDESRPGIVLHLFGPPPAVDGAPSVARDGSLCPKGRNGVWTHHAPLVDKVARTVSCANCERQLDPIDVLLEVARRHEDWTRLARESRTMRADLAAMQSEEKRVKARTKSAARKDAAAAAAAERAKLERELAEIACRTDDVRRAITRIDQLIKRNAPPGRGHIARALARFTDTKEEPE